ncbi:general substrate transporter [Xylariales sp. PMI_506]|nr:general substrate transporter [Xylariales sp. PMI_506]
MASILRSFKERSLYKDMTAYAWLVAVFSSLGALVFGYDAVWWSGVLGMSAFTQRFGVYNAATKSYAISAPLQSAGSGIPTAGRILGSVISPFIADRIGRRGCMLVMAILFIVAAIIEVTAQSFWQIVIGRFINYIPEGIAGNMIPVYQAECSPASCRGSLIAIYTWFVNAGATCASGIVFHTYFLKSEAAYKIVMGVQMIFPILLLVALPFIPESPRYLCMKGRRDESLAVLKKLRSSNDIAEQELLDIETALELRVSEGKWIDLALGSNLRRTMISWVIPIIEGWQGLSYMGSYLIVFLISLGATNQYLLSLLLQTTIFVTTTLTFWMPDRFGRRVMLMTGSTLMVISMYTTAGVSGRNTSTLSDTKRQTAVGMLFIWAIAHAATWQTLGYTAPAEIPTQKLRSKTGGMAYFFQQSGGLIVTFVSPYMQDAGYGDMGAYIGFFFGSFSLIGLIFVFFCYPETKGLSIENLDILFDKGTRTWDFTKAAKDQGGLPRTVLEDQGSLHEAKLGTQVVVSGNKFVEKQAV